MTSALDFLEEGSDHPMTRCAMCGTEFPAFRTRAIFKGNRGEPAGREIWAKWCLLCIGSTAMMANGLRD